MSVNKFLGIGNVGKIETRYMPNGEAVTNFSIAINENYKNKDGKKVEKTEWVNCIAFKKLAEIMTEYVKVGQSIFVEGKIQTRKWQTKEGQDRYSTEIIVNEMTMLGGKPQNEQEEEPAVFIAPARKANVPAMDSFDDFDASIPF